VLAYLYAHSRHGPLLEALARSGAQVVVVSGEAASMPAGGGLSGMRFVGDLLDLGAMAGECDLFVSCGSHASVCQTLSRGVPQLIVPELREQALTARRVVGLGAGLAAEAGPGPFDEVVARALGDPALREGAQRFAEAHAGDDAGEAAARFREAVRKLVP